MDDAAHHRGGSSGHPASDCLFDAGLKRSPVAQCFAGRRVGAGFVVGVPEQFIGGGDDVLDLRAGLGFEERYRSEQDRRVGINAVA